MERTDSLSQDYSAQLNDKVAQLTQLFDAYAMPKLEVFASPSQHYRMRAEFHVWHEEEDLYYVMFESQTRQRYRVDQFPAASQLINQLMPILLEHIKPHSILRHKLFQVDFLSTLSGEILVSLLYHKPLDDAWLTAAKLLKQQLNTLGFKLNLIGRARKIKQVIDQDWVLEKLHVNQQPFIYQQVENSFTQPNAKVAEKMLEWAVNCTQQANGDLLELYCGNGNFSLALAQNFRQVLATELAKPSVQAAHYNIAANGIDNVKIIRMSAEDFTQAMQKEREFQRLKEANVSLDDYQFSTVLVDPPRAGMDDKTCHMLQAYPRILYISCNPHTLKENLAILSRTHKVTRFALFDQFPYTHHMEAGVVLERIE